MRLFLRTLMVIAATAVCAATLASSSAGEVSRRTPHLVCFKGPKGERTWHEAVRPARCMIHRRHSTWDFPLFDDILWRGWQRYEAWGTAFWEFGRRVQIDFWRPRWGWSPDGKKRYFSRGLAWVWEGHWEKYRWRLDVPQGRKIPYGGRYAGTAERSAR